MWRGVAWQRLDATESTATKIGKIFFHESSQHQLRGKYCTVQKFGPDCATLDVQAFLHTFVDKILFLCPRPEASKKKKKKSRRDVGLVGVSLRTCLAPSPPPSPSLGFQKEIRAEPPAISLEDILESLFVLEQKSRGLRCLGNPTPLLSREERKEKES